MKNIFLGVALVLNAMSAVAQVQESSWDDPYNVYKYFKTSSGNCLYPKEPCSDLGSYDVTQFGVGWRFQTNPFGLNQTFQVDVTGDGTTEKVAKYSGSLGTYTAKHYPTAVKYNGDVYFVFSGPVNLDGYNAHNFTGEKTATTAGNGETSTYSGFLNSEGKSQVLGIYISKYDPVTKRAQQPRLIHAKYTDDPHDNAVINVDNNGYIYVMVAGRNTKRGSFLFRSKKAGDITDFVDISPDNYDYSSFNGMSGRIGVAYPKMFWVPNDGGYFRLVYTVYCAGGASCGGRNIFTARLNVNGQNQATLSDVTRLANYKGHYVIANAKGSDIVLAFNVHMNGRVDDRTNIYYMHSVDGGDTWLKANNSSVTLPLNSEWRLNQVSVARYHNEGDPIYRRIYMKDINFEGAGFSKRPMIMYVAALDYSNEESYKPSITADHYLGKKFWTGSSWKGARISNDVDHAYSSGALVINNVTWLPDTYRAFFPATPESENNGMGGGAIARSVTNKGNAGANPVYLTNTPIKPTSSYDLATLCEFNYIRPIHGIQSSDDTVAIAAGGNPYQYSDNNPIVFVENMAVRALPQRFSPSDLINGEVATTTVTDCN